LPARRPRLAAPPAFRPRGPNASRMRCTEASSSLSVDPFRSRIGQFALPMPAPGRRGGWPRRLRLGRPGAARGRSWPCQVRSRWPRTPRASSAGGANRVLPELLTPSVAPRIASRRSSTPVLGRPRPSFVGLRASSVPGSVPPPAGLGQNVDRGPRAPLVGLPSGLSTGRGCARSLCSSGAHPSHPSHGQDPSRRRPPAGALLSARPPDRWAPRGARQSRRTRCISPTCAKIDLPHEHPT